MSGNLTLASFLMILFSVTLGGFGQICLKKGASAAQIAIAASPVQTFLNILTAMMRPFSLLGLSLYVLSTFVWFLVISRVRLSVAYPMISMSYVLVVILSALILREKVDWRFAAAGLFCISLGVSFIGFGMGTAAGK